MRGAGHKLPEETMHAGALHPQNYITTPLFPKGYVFLEANTHSSRGSLPSCSNVFFRQKTDLSLTTSRFLRFYQNRPRISLLFFGV